MRNSVLFLCLLLAACGGQDRVLEVKVPVAVKAKPTPALLSRIKAPQAIFVAPGTQGATSCLLPAGEQELRALLHQLNTRQRAWVAYSAD